MAKYAQLSDCVDPVLVVSASNLDEADVYVDVSLSNIGIGPDEAATIPLPNATLKAIAVNWAKRLAAIDGAIQDNTLMISKADRFKANAEVLVSKLNRAVLGLSNPVGSGYSVFSLGRS